MQEPARDSFQRQTSHARPVGQRPGNGRADMPLSANVRRARRKKARLKRRMTLVVMAVLVVALFVTAILITTALNGSASSVVSSVSPAMSAISAPMASQPEPESVSVAPPREATPYDEAAMPYLFNYANPIPQEYRDALELVSVGGGHTMAPRAAEAYLAMVAAAAEDGITMVPLSGYRTYERQKGNYDRSIQNYLAQGYSEAEAKRLTEQYYAIPGTSEHEAGLAMDIGDASAPGTNIQDGFEDTPAFAWLQENCVKFGFIMRYEAHTTDITHINYEPWHYRYVGANHAEIIAEEGITLEEYIEAYG